MQRGGVQVHISLNTFEQLGNDESVMLHTHMVVRKMPNCFTDSVNPRNARCSCFCSA